MLIYVLALLFTIALMHYITIYIEACIVSKDRVTRPAVWNSYLINIKEVSYSYNN